MTRNGKFIPAVEGETHAWECQRALTGMNPEHLAELLEMVEITIKWLKNIDAHTEDGVAKIHRLLDDSLNKLMGRKI